MNSNYKETLEKLGKAGRLRTLKPLAGRNGCRILYRGREMLNLTSNDYLGLAGDKEVHHRFYAGMNDGNILDDFGLGAASSRLLTGDSAQRLEETLRLAYDKEACLLYNSGYHANIGILPAILGKNDLILSDKLNHASIMVMESFYLQGDAHLPGAAAKTKRFGRCLARRADQAPTADRRVDQYRAGHAGR